MENTNNINLEEVSGLNTAIAVGNMTASIKRATDEQKQMKQTLIDSVGVTEEDMNNILQKVSGLSSEEIKKLSDEEVNEIFTIDNKEITIELQSKNMNKATFLRDFLEYAISMEEGSKKIDKCVVEMETELEKHTEELNNLIKDNGSFYNVMKGNLTSLKASSKLKDNSQVDKLLECFDDVVTLNPIIEYLNIVNPRNVLMDYMNRDIEVYKKYKNVMRHNGIKTDLVKSKDLGILLANTINGEKEINGDDKSVSILSNIVVFTMIRYFSNKSNFCKVKDLGFITVFSLLYAGIKTGQMTLETDKETIMKFSQAHDRIVNIFIPFIK